MSQTTSSQRLAVVLSHPTQYYSPWFRWIRSHAPMELKVFYLWDFGVVAHWDPNFDSTFKWDVDLLSGYDYEFVPNLSRKAGPEYFFGFNNPSLPKRLANWRPTSLLLFGYKSASHIRAAFWARRNGVRILFRGDSHLLGRRRPRLHARLALRMLYSQFDSFLYVGSANREYFEALGVPNQKLFFAPHSVNSALYNSADPSHKAAAQELRSHLGLSPTTKVVLFAGKLIEEKQPVALLRAFLKLRLPDTVLIYVGDGPQRQQLKEISGTTDGRPDAAAVRFLPFANQSEMPARYLLADLFVLPSRGLYETWGLAVNEAMHMAVPCLVSDRVGCQRDLVIHGETGWVFDAMDPQSLENALGQALVDLGSPRRLLEIRRAVGEKIAGYTYTQTTDGLLAALAAVHG